MIDVEGDAKWNVLLMGNPLAKELSGIKTAAGYRTEI